MLASLLTCSIHTFILLFDKGVFGYSFFSRPIAVTNPMHIQYIRFLHILLKFCSFQSKVGAITVIYFSNVIKFLERRKYGTAIIALRHDKCWDILIHICIWGNLWNQFFFDIFLWSDHSGQLYWFVMLPSLTGKNFVFTNFHVK